MAGSMSGSVIDIRNNMPIEGAAIAAKEDGGSGSGNATSAGSDGGWGPISLPAGTYDVTVSAPGYDPGDYPGIVVLDNVDTRLPFALHPASDH